MAYYYNTAPHSLNCLCISATFAVVALIHTKITETCLSKKRKKFTPSQKLCLKSQKTSLSQESVLKTSSLVSDSNSTEQENSKKSKQLVLRKNNLDLSVISDCKDTEFPHTSKVSDWLSQLPVPLMKKEKAFSIEVQDYEKIESFKPSKVEDRLLHLSSIDVELEEAADLLSDLPTNTEVRKKLGRHSRNIEKKKLLRSRISIHRTPALKTNVAMISNHKDFHPASFENEDPNKIPMLSSDHNEPILLTDDYNSPLQMWLKQELVSSIKNNAFESKETSKGIIVCATKTKDVIISVGCSHMTCDTCYPDVTDLLLGYG